MSGDSPGVQPIIPGFRAYLKIRLLVVSAENVPEERFGEYSVVASAPRVCGGQQTSSEPPTSMVHGSSMKASMVVALKVVPGTKMHRLVKRAEMTRIKMH